MLTLEILKENLHYNPDTGVFIWIKRGRNRQFMKEAGTLDYRRYRQININYTIYKTHRLAWFYITGEWPKDQIDHINLNKEDNRWCNLRESSNRENQINQTIDKTNTSGFKGVSFDKSRGLWVAYVARGNRRTKYIGRYDCKAAAYFARIVAAEIDYKEFARHE